MGNAWFDIASPEHFWIRRRFEVLRNLAADIDWHRLKIAEIGCGNGMIQRQFEDQLEMEIDGFDLNEKALQSSVSRKSQRFCYNLYDRNDRLRQAYDGLLFFDVIEHIEDHRAFLEAARFHLKPGGFVIINVPALPTLFSAYDVAAGHVRRYLAEDLVSLVEKSGLQPGPWTYWGKPMLPLLRLRKFRMERMKNEADRLRDGFDSRGAFTNAALLALSRLESLPRHDTGTSLMLLATVC